MSYYVFLGVIPLPVTPAKISIKTPSKNQTVTLINDGEINILKTPGLREISFDFLLPQGRYPFTNEFALAKEYTASVYIPLLNTLNGVDLSTGVSSVDKMLSGVNDILTQKPPFQFIVTRMSPSGKILYHTNIKCQIESLTYDEDAEAHGLDVMCSITLKEYKDYGTSQSLFDKVMEVASLGVGAATTVFASTSSERSTSSKSTPTKYTVKEGDTLWNICKQQLGDGQKYKEIAKLNNIENPDLIQVGQVLRLK